ncbi:MAG: response regulator [Deinococcales bacterium]
MSLLVLAVDDEPGILKLVELSMRSANFDVVTYDNPWDALDDLAEGLRPDAIIGDVSMPALDGFSFYEKVREIPELRAVPFIFLTALGERKHIRYGMSIGADDYITKPFEREELVQAVKIRLQRVAELRRPAESLVKVIGLGHPLVEKDGERLDWDSLKALELLFYLLEHRSGVSTFEVAEALWPGKTESKASSSFHTTLYRLRKVMSGEIVESANRRYYLHSKFDILYDADLYRQASAKARETSDLKDYAAAAKLYTGNFLLGFDSEWVENIRLNLHAEHLTLLLACAEKFEQAGNLEESTRFYRAMTEHEPYSETAWEGLAKVWEKRGEQSRANEIRDRFRMIMEAES